MKEEIKKYFSTNRSHADGVALVMKYSNRLSLKKQLNIHPESDYLTGVVHQELCDIAGITPQELHNMLHKPIRKPETGNEEIPAEVAEVQQPVEIKSTKAEKQDKAPEVKKASRKK